MKTFLTNVYEDKSTSTVVIECTFIDTIYNIGYVKCTDEVLSCTILHSSTCVLHPSTISDKKVIFIAPVPSIDSIKYCSITTCNKVIEIEL